MGVSPAKRKSETTEKMKRRNKSVKENEKLTVIDGETLMDMRLEPTAYAVKTFLPQGLCILGGAPKIGKSWLVLDLCVRIAKGETIWNMETKRGTALYLCLEDSYARIQERLNSVTDEVPPNIFFAVCAKTMAEGLCDQIRAFVSDHPDTVIAAIDTFQIVRKGDTDISYGNDYQEIRILKALADELKITILLVHHLRKQGDSDPLNKLSGSTGISGAADAAYILDVSRRSQNGATLFCTGRDIDYREIELRFCKEKCLWEVVSDSLENPQILLPKEMTALIAFMKATKKYFGSNTEFAEQFLSYSGFDLSVKSLKQMMNRHRYELEENGVFYENSRSNGQRYLKIYFSSAGDESAVKDAKKTCGETCGTFVPCVPETQEVRK